MENKMMTATLDKKMAIIPDRMNRRKDFGFSAYCFTLKKRKISKSVIKTSVAYCFISAAYLMCIVEVAKIKKAIKAIFSS